MQVKEVMTADCDAHIWKETGEHHATLSASSSLL
jgi:hypothetical protein